jgi:hypothetical protein
MSDSDDIHEMAGLQLQADYILIDALRQGFASEGRRRAMALHTLPSDVLVRVGRMHAMHKIHLALYRERYGVDYTDARGRQHEADRGYQAWLTQRRRAA